MTRMSVDFLKFLPLEEGKTYAFIGNAAFSSEVLVLLDEKTSKLEGDVCIVETTSGATVVQACTVRDARLAVDGGLYSGVVSFNSSPNTSGHVKSLAGKGGFFVHVSDNNRPSYDAVKGE